MVLLAATVGVAVLSEWLVGFYGDEAVNGSFNAFVRRVGLAAKCGGRVARVGGPVAMVGGPVALHRVAQRSSSAPSLSQVPEKPMPTSWPPQRPASNRSSGSTRHTSR